MAPSIIARISHRAPSTASHCSSQCRFFALCDNPRVSRTDARKRPISLAIFLIITGLIGFVAAFALTLDKFRLLENPKTVLSCDYGLFLNCSPNLNSAQGAVFGFPNPLIGIACFVAPIAVGVALLAGARFTRWLWLLFNLGIVGALVFVIWLMGQSLFVIGTLCPWCLVTWMVVIPLFWVVTLYNLKAGNISQSRAVRRFGATAYSWVISLTILSYLVVAILIQVGLDAIQKLF